MRKKLLTLGLLFTLTMNITSYANQNTNPADIVETIEINELTASEVRKVEKMQSVNGDYISLGNFKLTAYCECAKCNWPYVGCPTASGTDYVEGRTIAVDPRVIPLGTAVEINVPGEGWHEYIAEDTGGAIKGKRIDVFVSGHQNCLQSQFNKTCEVRVRTN